MRMKKEMSSFVIISDALLNEAYRVSLHDPGAELRGGGRHPRRGASGAEYRAGRLKEMVNEQHIVQDIEI